MSNVLLLAATLFFASPPDSTVTLDEISIHSTPHTHAVAPLESSQAGIRIGQDFLETNFAASLSQTLQAVPGVKAMAIGSGQSKPVIRGLGFNRMAVIVDGVKHEGQQWGDDHGLEIDQFSISRIEVVKGPSALFYGSDAIGGVLDIHTRHVPEKKIEGGIHLFGQSNNEQIGMAANVGGTAGRFFYRANMTLIDYADYRVPADSILHNTYWIRLPENRLRNTAGMERDGGVMIGFAGANFHSDLQISDSYSKSGFFADAHGFEVNFSDIDYNASWRDIDLPMQTVNHLKVLSHSTYMGDNYSVDATLAFQNNLREEYSEAVSHGYRPKPDGTLERRFDKNTYTANIGMRWFGVENNMLRAGINAEYQHNRRGGWGFVIPDYGQFAAGLFAFDRFSPSEVLSFNAGLRYDFATLDISPYTDWYRTPQTTGDTVYEQRAASLMRRFSCLTWSAGVRYAPDHWVLKANIGKGFRLPLAKELGVNGINYHIFRYEKGNSNLDPESSYQIDGSVSWNNDFVSFLVEPYLNYFANYIYLNPTHIYTEGLQLYSYTQARVLRYGIEGQADLSFSSHWEATLKGEYLYARQLSGQKKGYGLPFSVPWSADVEGRYHFDWGGCGHIGLDVHIVGAQHDIVPPEKPTEGYWTLNASIEKEIRLGGQVLKVSLRANNLLNRRYYDHTSYYRLMEIPEPGRNFALRLNMEI